jgi:5-carboxymethyl-2-hydroxymuconate isomerase
VPHVVLEYSDNLPDRPDLRRILLEIHDVLVATGAFAREAIKSRAIRHDTYAVADGASERGFVALEIRILEGRSDEVKVAAAEGALAVLERAFAQSLARLPVGLSVEIRDMDRASYRRRRGPG